MKTEDAIFTLLGERFPELLAYALSGIEPRKARILPLPLPTVRKVESDFALEILSPSPSHVLHAEHWSARGKLALTAFYHMWYHESTGLPVRTVVVTTSPRLAKAVPREYAFRVGGARPTRVPLEVFHLWRLSACMVLAKRQVVLYPFVPLMRDPRGGRALLADLRAHIMQDVDSERDRRDLRAAAYFIAAKRFDEGLLRAVLGGVEEMAKTDLGQKLIEQGVAIGVERGKAIGVEQGKAIGVEQGKAIGEAGAKRQTLLRQLRAKFGALPEEAVLRIEDESDLALLDALLERILTAATIEELGL